MGTQIQHKQENPEKYRGGIFFFFQTDYGKMKTNMDHFHFIPRMKKQTSKSI